MMAMQTWIRAGLKLLAVGMVAGLVGGCATSPSSTISELDRVAPPVLMLAPGDRLQIEFFGAPELNTEQVVRRDGKITLKLVGEVPASGMTPERLRQDLLNRYRSQLQIESISVGVVSAVPVFVTGAVLAPGRFDLERPMTVIEAIMQARGFDPAWADVKRVTVIRHEHDQRKGYVFNMKDALAGYSGPSFYLKPYDIVYVPQKRIWPW